MAALTRDYLNYQSERIERVLASHRVPARVHSGTVSPRWIRFLVTPALGARVATVRNLSEELALALGAQAVRVARDGESLALEMPRLDAEIVHLSRIMRQTPEVPQVAAFLGLAEDGRPLLARLPSPDVAHILVAGMTGSGKTELMRTMLLSLAMCNRQSKLQLALIDPKRRGFAPLRGLPHLLTAPAEDAAGALALLDRLVQEMERRDREGISSPRIVIAVDELLDLLALESAYLTSGRNGHSGTTVIQSLTRLAQRGREAGLHLVIGVQKPSTAALGPMLKANFPVRLVGRVASAEDARVAAGQAASGAERLLGRGDFVAVAGGQTVHFQAAWVSPEEWPGVLERCL